MDLKAEHFIPECSGEEISYKIGNIIPVIKDNFGNKSISEKIEKYKHAKTDQSIQKFLEYDIDENNYIQKINKRSEDISEEFCRKFKELLNEFVREA